MHKAQAFLIIFVGVPACIITSALLVGTLDPGDFGQRPPPHSLNDHQVVSNKVIWDNNRPYGDQAAGQQQTGASE